MWALHNEALAPTGAHVGNGVWDKDLHQIEDVYINNGGEFLVGIHDGQLVAMGALKRTSADKAEIKRMRVKPAFQRRGFGQRILKALEKRADALGYKTLHLSTTVLQEAAQRFYEKNGYTEISRGEVYSFLCVFYEKRISTE